VVQMAGKPGSGKSTLARGIGAACEAVVLDKDVIKSAALNAGAEESLAGPLAYEVLFDLARSLLGMAQSVVLDSPAFYPQIVEKGRQLAADAGASYHVIECVCLDRDELARRLSAGERLRSQPRGLGQLVDAASLPGTAPFERPHLVVDTTRPDAECLRLALEYIGETRRLPG